MAAIRKEDIQNIVGEVRDMLELRTDPSETDQKRLAQKYTAVLQQVNGMLKTCLELVEKGRKLDAITRADENSLLEIVSILDFPELPVWVDYLNQFGFPPPPAVDQFACRQISACYAPARRLEPLQRLNRRHALANSPLKVKLGVMRRIHRMEAGTEKDVAGRQVEVFEMERLKSVRKELADAMQAQDQRALKLLCAELSSKDWLKAPDAGLVQNAVRSLRQEEARRARLQMKDLAAQLQNMWSAHDVAGGRRIRETWDTCQKHARLTDEDLLIQETRAAFQWLKGIDDEELKKQKYDELVAKLREGLDQQKAKEFLEPLEHALNDFEEGVPESLRGRLQARYNELETESGRTYVRRLVVASLAVVSTAGLLFYWQYNSSVDENIAGHTSALTTLLEQGDVDAAERYSDTLHEEQPEMLQVPQIQVLLVEIEQARQIEDARREAYLKAKQAIIDGLDSAVTLADATSLREQLDALNTSGAEEEDEAEQLTADIEKKRQEIQTGNDDAFAAAVQEAAAELKDYETTGPPDIKRFEQFRTRFNELERTSDVSPELIAGSAGPKQLAARCETRISEMYAQTERDKMLQRITESVGLMAEYRTAIDAYVKAFPKEPLAIRFENLLRTEADVWLQVDIQNTFVREHSVDCTTLNPMEARKYLSEAEAFLVTHPQFPRRAELTRICEYLRFVSQRVNEDGIPIHEAIQEQLDSANLQDLFLVLMQTGQRHYTNKEPEILTGTGRVHFFPLTDWLAAARERDTDGRNFAQDDVDIRLRGGKPDWIAPESALIRNISRDITRIQGQDWEKVMIEMLERVFAETRQDPIFRLYMFRTILEAAVVGSPLISERYSQILMELKDEQLSGINPFDPDDESTNTTRKHAVELLKAFEDPSTLAPALMAHRDALSKVSLGGQYRWIGWLNYTPAGWVCAGSQPFPAGIDGPLSVYIKAGTDVPHFLQIGTMKQGKSTISNSSAFLTEGNPVYVYKE